MDNRSKRIAAFSDIGNAESLISYLESGDRRSNIHSLHHYTSIDVAVKIIREQFWHLGKAQYMNDTLEYDSGDSFQWEQLFFSSFMGEDKESIAMWSMYGQPWEKGVKISIPKSSVTQWLKDVSVVYEISLNDFKPSGRTQSIDKNTLKVVAVAYSNCHDTEDEEEQVLRWSTVENRELNINPKNFDVLTGYIKNKAWAYEKEFRIMLRQEEGHSLNRAAIEVPDYLIDALKITPSPLFEGDFTKILYETIQREVHITNSLFLNKLNIRSVCSKCEYKLAAN